MWQTSSVSLFDPLGIPPMTPLSSSVQFKTVSCWELHQYTFIIASSVQNGILLGTSSATPLSSSVQIKTVSCWELHQGYPAGNFTKDTFIIVSSDQNGILLGTSPRTPLSSSVQFSSKRYPAGNSLKDTFIIVSSIQNSILLWTSPRTPLSSSVQFKMVSCWELPQGHLYHRQFNSKRYSTVNFTKDTFIIASSVQNGILLGTSPRTPLSSSVQFGSKRYLCTRKGPYMLLPVSEVFSLLSVK